MVQGDFSYSTWQYIKFTIPDFRKIIFHGLRCWVPVPVEAVCNGQILNFINFLRAKRLKTKTVNCDLQSIRGFYDYLYDEEGLRITNPVKTVDFGVRHNS